jgi:ABC-type spermidine/putrescine transport system permease subunit II
MTDAAARPWRAAGDYFIVLILLYLPLGCCCSRSIPEQSLSRSLAGADLHWYERLFEAPEVLRAGRNSLSLRQG